MTHTPLHIVAETCNRKQREAFAHGTRDKMNAGKILYNELTPLTIATFVLPPLIFGSGGLDDEDALPLDVVADSQDRISMREALATMPFPAIRIRRRLVSKDNLPRDTGFGIGGEEPSYAMTGTLAIDTDVIIVSESDHVADEYRWLWAAKDIVYSADGGMRTIYTPNKYTGLKVYIDSCPASFVDLLRFLEDRRNRYIENPVTRQVRRAEGLSPDYKEYIVMRKPSAKEAKTMLRLGEVFRRSPKLHVVRGHLRHLRSGRVAVIPPHARGVGTMLQVKDYVAEEENPQEALPLPGLPGGAALPA